MKPLKVFAIGAEATVVSTLAVASYHVAFAGTGSSSDWLAGVPILTVVALESLRLPVAFNLCRSKLPGFLLGCSLLAGLTVVTGEAAMVGFENLIFQRTRPVAEAERDLKKVENAHDTLNAASGRRDAEIAQLKDDVEKTRAHQTEIAQTSVAQLPVPPQLPMPVYQAPVPQPVPAPLKCSRGKKGGTYICNAAARDKVTTENADAERKAREAYETARHDTIKKNGETQDQVNRQNAEAQKTHDKNLSDASDAVRAAEARLAAVDPAPDMHVSDAAVEEAKQRVADARAMNPMFRVAAAWQKIPVQDLTLEQFEAVKSWAVFALAVATAATSALAAIIASFAERGTGPSSKLNRMLRAWIARRRKPIVVHRDVPVPGPETIKEVEVVKEVAGPVEYREKIEYRDVPGPVEYRDIEKIVYRDVPGPERIVEKVVIKWVPYDVASGLRVKPDGSLGEVAHIRSAQ
jgi:hypothetical protein